MRTAELYQRVTDSIVAQLEAGVVPWTKPWKTTGMKGVAYVPMNAATGRAYTGINVMLLWATALERGYKNHGWMTFKQANEIGAHVRKGEHGSTVVFAKWTEAEDDDGKTKKRSLLKTYTVFHVDQLEKLPEVYTVKAEPPPEASVYKGAKQLIVESGIKVEYGGSKAAYIPALDVIQLPPFKAFNTPEDFFGTAFHELVHATGHKARLDRDLSGRFKSKAYAFEELIAELGSAFLCAHEGIEGTTRSADYVADWLSVLKDDRRAIFQAASYAPQAADWLREKAYAVTDETPDVEKAAEAA